MGTSLMPRSYRTAGPTGRHCGLRFGHRLVPSGLGVGDASGSLIESAAVVVGILLAGGGAALGLAQHAANRRIEPALLCATWKRRDAGYEGAACSEAAAVRGQQQALLGAGSVAVGVGLAGVSVSVAFGAKAGEVGDSAGEWDPWDIERGEP